MKQNKVKTFFALHLVLQTKQNIFFSSSKFEAPIHVVETNAAGDQKHLNPALELESSPNPAFSQGR